MIGQTIAHYRILAKLGAGGWGSMPGRDRKLGLDVAVKLLLPALSARLERALRA